MLHEKRLDTFVDTKGAQSCNKIMQAKDKAN